jgi:lysozyme family protein
MAALRALASLFQTGITVFKDKIEDFMMDDSNDLETCYQVSIPWVLRGVLIHLMNEALNYEQHIGEMFALS